MLNYWSVNVIL